MSSRRLGAIIRSGWAWERTAAVTLRTWTSAVAEEDDDSGPSIRQRQLARGRRLRANLYCLFHVLGLGRLKRLELRGEARGGLVGGALGHCAVFGQAEVGEAW